MQFLNIVPMNPDQIDSLIKLGIGDMERLKHIKQSIEQGKTVYNSDRDYVERLISQQIANLAKNNESETEKVENVEPKSESEMNSNVAYCGKCGQKVDGTIYFCPKCGSQINQSDSKRIENNYQNSHSQSNANSRLQRPAEWKSESITLLLSILLGLFGIQGVGHMYVGKIVKGVVILIGSFVLFIVAIVLVLTIVGAVIGIPLIIIYIVMFIWQILDSRKLCREYNDYYEQYGKPPNW